MIVRLAFVTIALTSVMTCQAGQEPLLPLLEVASADHWLQARVPVKAAEIRKEADRYVATLDIGARTPITCEVFPDALDLADALRRHFDQWLQQTGSRDGNIRMLQLEATDAGAIGGVPYLSTRWRFGAKEGGDYLKLGSFKQRAFNKLDHGIHCSHLNGAVQARVRTSMLMPDSGKMHSHDSDDTVLLGPDGATTHATQPGT